MPRRNPNHARLLADPDIARWHANVARGSKITADVYLRRVGCFCETVGVSPKDMVRLSAKRLKNLMMDFVTAEEKKGRAGSYIHHSTVAARSWLSFNDVRMDFKLRIRAERFNPTVENERVPEPEELRKIIEAGDSRDRVCVLLMAHAGVRPEVLGNYDGTDGLKLGDFPELVIEKDSVIFSKVPAVVVVRAQLSKASHKYLTFIGEEASKAVVTYLAQRIQKGEVLSKDSDLIAPAGNWTAGVGSKEVDRSRLVKLPNGERKKFIATPNVSMSIKTAIVKSGFAWRPYVLRSYFSTRLDIAEANGRVTHSHRVYWTGHTGDMSAHYSTNKGQLSPTTVETMRDEYRLCEVYLTTDQSRVSKEAEEKFRRGFLRGVGFSPEELGGLHLDELDEDAIAALVAKKLEGGAKKAEGPRQKVIGIDELEKYVLAGWELVPGGMNHTRAVITPRES